jgi:hypothetical protein
MSQISLAQSNGSQQPQRQGYSWQQHGKKHQWKSNYPTIQSDTNVNTAPDNGPPDNGRHEEKEDTKINRNIMRATWVIAFVAFLQLIAIGVQAYILQRTVKATEKAADAADRSATAVVRIESAIIRTVGSPRLIAVDINVAHPGQPWHNVPRFQGFVKGLRFINYGRTPAFPYQLASGWKITDKLPDVPQYDKSSPLPPDLIISPAGEPLDVDETSTSIEPSDDQILAIDRGSAWIWFYFCLYYRDFMNDKQEFRFGWKFANINKGGPYDIYFDFVSDSDIPEAYTKST